MQSNGNFEGLRGIGFRISASPSISKEIHALKLFRDGGCVNFRIWSPAPPQKIDFPSTKRSMYKNRKQLNDDRIAPIWPRNRSSRSLTEVKHAPTRPERGQNPPHRWQVSFKKNTNLKQSTNKSAFSLDVWVRPRWSCPWWARSSPWTCRTAPRRSPSPGTSPPRRSQPVS